MWQSQKPLNKLFFLLGAGFIALSFCYLLSACRTSTQRPTGSGTLEGEVVRVPARIASTVKEVWVREGQTVEEGEVLARLDDEMLRISLRQAETGVALAENRLRLLLKGAREEDIRQMEAALVKAEENLKSAREDNDRMQTLFQSGSITQKQKEDAELRYKIAEAEYAAAVEGLKKMKNWARPEEVEAARIQLDQARANRDQVLKQLEYMEVKAPRRGTILTQGVYAGEYVIPGSTLFTLADLDSLYLTIYVPETLLGTIRLGQKAKVKVDTFPDHGFPAEVVFISSQAEFTPRNVQTQEERVKLVYGVKLRVKNQDGVLKIGMPADAVLE
ncbi:MAG: efflux RND transporter periplasmic adaptor subunit [Spirochaetes bacterium]|nr:efflux RND transporter periplasmic adaptor subunit [Spirochaetota bacterium]